MADNRVGKRDRRAAPAAGNATPIRPLVHPGFAAGGSPGEIPRVTRPAMRVPCRRMKRCLMLAVPVAVAAAGVGPARGDDWPDFRGPKRRGVSAETGWRSDWNAQAPKTLWKVQVGIGRSSCTVAGGRVFATGANRDDREAVICLDASTGREIWRCEYACRFSEGPDG